MQPSDQESRGQLDGGYLSQHEELDAVAAEYLRREEEFDEVAQTSRIYAKGSETLANGLRAQWRSYCHKVMRDQGEELKRFEVKRISLFFHFLLAQRRGTLRHTSTLQTYWNTLCLVRRRDTGLQNFEQHVKEAMVGLRQQLANEFTLKSEKQAKPIVRAEDEYALLQTLWSLPPLTLDHERLRVQLALIAQLADITGNRPGALLALCYGNLKVTLLRDPARIDRPNVTLEFTFKKTKSYRGPKDP